MPTYISLLRYTEQGIKNIKESPARLDGVRDLFKTLGADLKAFYLVTGKYDAVCISEAPDDATVGKLLLSLGSKGNVRTETFRAFTEDEFRKIVAALP
ncbi:GYD domain-containing protein [bacterium]|nr:GYD domain-containing protein [bacterium]